MPANNECEHRITTLTDNRSQEHIPKPQLHAGNQLYTMHCASQIYWFCSNWPWQCPYSFCFCGTQFFREAQNQDSKSHLRASMSETRTGVVFDLCGTWIERKYNEQSFIAWWQLVVSTLTKGRHWQELVKLEVSEQLMSVIDRYLLSTRYTQQIKWIFDVNYNLQRTHLMKFKFFCHIKWRTRK